MIILSLFVFEPKNQLTKCGHAKCNRKSITCSSCYTQYLHYHMCARTEHHLKYKLNYLLTSKSLLNSRQISIFPTIKFILNNIKMRLCS